MRGDGRRFIANLQSPGLARKDDLWQCFLFTRGGPEWESIRVRGEYSGTPLKSLLRGTPDIRTPLYKDTLLCPKCDRNLPL